MIRAMQTIVVVSIFLLSTFSAPYCKAQLTEIASRHIPEESLAVLTVWPKALASKPSMKYAPVEVFTAVGIEEAGIDPVQLERVDVVFGLPAPWGPTFGAVVQSAVPIDIRNMFERMVDDAGIQNEDGFEYIATRGPEQIVLHQVDAKTILFGTRPFLKRMVAERKSQSQMAKTIASIRSEQDALLLVAMDTLRPMLLPLLGQVPLPQPVVENLSGVCKTTDLLALRVVITDGETLQLVLSSQDEAGAQQLERHLADLVQFGIAVATAQAQSELDPEQPTGSATLAYMNRLAKVLPELLAPRRIGNRLVLEIEQFQSVSLLGTGVALLLPAVQASREAARRMQSSNNLKQIGLAMHNFESAYRKFPATGAAGDDGKPMLSWRVAILPFIEEVNLYNRFNLDEPWDSEHNLALLEEMPSVYVHPDKPTKAGHTVYQAPVGSDTLLQLDAPSGFRNVTDGTSNTIMIVEVAPEAAVPWTAPQDWEIDHDEPNVAALFFNGITQATFGDGSVRVLAESIDIEVLKALLTRSGGEIVPNF